MKINVSHARIGCKTGSGRVKYEVARENAGRETIDAKALGVRRVSRLPFHVSLSSHVSHAILPFRSRFPMESQEIAQPVTHAIRRGGRFAFVFGVIILNPLFEIAVVALGDDPQLLQPDIEGVGRNAEPVFQTEQQIVGPVVGKTFATGMRSCTIWVKRDTILRCVALVKTQLYTMAKAWTTPMRLRMGLG